MFRNKTFLTFLNACLAFLAVFIFFQIQQRDVVIKLNNHNLSMDAYQVRLKKNWTAAQIDQKLNDAKKIDDIQVHYRPRGSKKLTYFYGKGSFATPPMVSGNFFSKNDFVSDLSVAVVGQKLNQKLYKPKDQQYLKLNGRYVPVIGVMGEKISSNLDRQIFIAPSQKKLQHMKASQYDIMIDGDKNLQAAEIKAILPISEIQKSHSQQFVMTRWEWATTHWLELIGLLGIFAVMAIEIFLWRFSSHKFYTHILKAGAKVAQLALNEWASYSLFSGLGILAGTFIGCLTFSIQNYAALILYLISCFGAVSLLFKFFVKRGIKKSK